MTRSITCAFAAVAVVLAASGCLELEHKSSLASPSQISDLKSLLGTWSSASVLPSADSCTEFTWEVTEQSGNTASGNFSATCPGGLKVSGRASGVQLGTVISWTATGNATAPNLPACAISLTGNAYLEVDRIRVPYSGQTCLGAVKGEEILKRN
jgi:hypothetical protein